MGNIACEEKANNERTSDMSRGTYINMATLKGTPVKEQTAQMNSYTIIVVDEETMSQELGDLSLMDSGFDGVNTPTYCGHGPCLM